MLDKEIFKKTEGQLYGYFRDLKEIELLEIDCRDLQEQEKNIQWSMESMIENEGEKEIKQLKDELKFVNKKLCKNMARIRQLKRNIAILKKRSNSPSTIKRNYGIYYLQV